MWKPPASTAHLSTLVRDVDSGPCHVQFDTRSSQVLASTPTMCKTLGRPTAQGRFTSLCVTSAPPAMPPGQWGARKWVPTSTRFRPRGMGQQQTRYTYGSCWGLVSADNTASQWKLKSNSVVMHIVRDDSPDMEPYYTTWFYKCVWAFCFSPSARLSPYDTGYSHPLCTLCPSSWGSWGERCSTVSNTTASARPSRSKQWTSPSVKCRW